MKKFLILCSLVLLMVVVAPLRVKAADIYGTELKESEGWLTKPDGSKYISQTYSITKVVNGYVYYTLNEIKNVKIDINSIQTSLNNNFELVSVSKVETMVNDVEVSAVEVLVKPKDGYKVSGKTELFTVLADIVDPNIQDELKCSLTYTPLVLNNCSQVGDHYFNDKGVEVSKEDFDKACSGQPSNPSDVPGDDVPDEPAATGPVIPYIAVGLGLVAIGGLYFYSRKSNKMFKI